MEPPQPKPTRKRNRKRKRRIISDSSSSEALSSSSPSDPDLSTPQKNVTAHQLKPASSDEYEDDLSEYVSSDGSQEDAVSAPDEEDVDMSPPSKPNHPQPVVQRDSPSPQPIVDIPPFIQKNAPESERALKERFRKFWMASIAEGFRDDLEEIRKEPDLGPSRLALLIESLASGADVFSGSVDGSINEMQVVLDQLS